MFQQFSFSEEQHLIGDPSRLLKGMGDQEQHAARILHILPDQFLRSHSCFLIHRSGGLVKDRKSIGIHHQPGHCHPGRFAPGEPVCPFIFQLRQRQGLHKPPGILEGSSPQQKVLLHRHPKAIGLLGQIPYLRNRCKLLVCRDDPGKNFGKC